MQTLSRQQDRDPFLHLWTREEYELMAVIEISDSTLRFDRQVKGSLYARADLQDYWNVKLVDKCLEVYRSPQVDPEAMYGFRYDELGIYTLDQSVIPLALPDKPTLVADLLPEIE